METYSGSMKERNVISWLHSQYCLLGTISFTLCVRSEQPAHHIVPFCNQLIVPSREFVTMFWKWKCQRALLTFEMLAKSKLEEHQWQPEGPQDLPLFVSITWMCFSKNMFSWLFPLKLENEVADRQRKFPFFGSLPQMPTIAGTGCGFGWAKLGNLDIQMRFPTGMVARIW